jgi:hypothetical protein
LDPEADYNLVLEPKYQFRTHHIHTEHPLEMCEMLNGFGEHMSQDDQGSFNKNIETDFESFLEWMLANTQNHVEWVLLSSPKWSKFADSALRQSRLKTIVDRAHMYGINVGLDAAMSMQQQNAWTLIRNPSETNLTRIMQEVQTHVDYIMQCGFDYITTEMGTTEFTTGDIDLQLRIMNATIEYLWSKYGARFFTKSHISQGQIVKEYKDPITGKPGCNFNFLPYYLDERLGVCPHTVQMFSFMDPSHTYGNQNFTQMFRFLQVVGKSHYTVWYPETAYWVTHDINVPLFLPAYFDRRLQDLELIDDNQVSMNGQMLFSSGWQFGYWLNDVISSRAAWNTKWNQKNHETNLKYWLDQTVGKLGLTNLLNDFITKQRDMLIFGKVAGQPDPPLHQARRAGIAYVQGWDTFAELMTFVDIITGMVLETQPRKLGYLEVMYGIDVLESVHYSTIQKLLASMNDGFQESAQQFMTASQESVPVHLRPLFQDIVDSVVIFSKRTCMVYNLYEYAHGKHKGWNQTVLEQLSQNAKQCILDAHVLVNRRLEHTGVSLDRITAWRENPTVYKYTYLWTAKTLFYWWRDYVKVTKNIKTPCLMNIIDPIETAKGDGIAQHVAQKIRNLLDSWKHFEWVADCIAGPDKEPQVPPV